MQGGLVAPQAWLSEVLITLTDSVESRISNVSLCALTESTSYFPFDFSRVVPVLNDYFVSTRVHFSYVFQLYENSTVFNTAHSGFSLNALFLALSFRHDVLRVCEEFPV